MEMKNNAHTQYNKTFFENMTPNKLTECRRLKLHNISWGLLSDYSLESVKINRYKPNQVLSTAIFQVVDKSGQITCILKGKSVGLLFGLSSQEWSNIEDMCDCGQQLFYRNFKDGLSTTFSCEQKLFYNFCLTNQREDVFIVVFSRTNNIRNKDTSDALINIYQLRKVDGFTLDLFINHLKRRHK